MASRPGRRVVSGVSIRAKVVMITLIPLVAMLVFACLLTFNSAQQAQDAQRIRQFATLGDRTAVLVDDLQTERTAAADYVANPGTTAQQPTLLEFVARGKASDSALKDFVTVSGNLGSDAKAPISSELERVSQGVGAMQRNRTDVLEQARTAGVRVGAATSIYAQLIKDLLAMKQRLASAATGDQDLSDQLVAASAFTRYKEAIGEEQVAVDIALHDDHGRFTNDTLNDYRSAVSDQNAFENQFLISATDAQRATRNTTLTKELPYQQLSTRAQSAGLDQNLSFDQATWKANSAGENALLQSVERRLDAAAVQATGAFRDTAIRKAIVLSAIALATLALALLASLFVGRSMVRSLVRLRSSAFEVAYQSLPAVVRRLEDMNPELDPESDLEDAGPAALRTLEIRSGDEIGQVAQAFNAVHLEAVRVASEQAQLRQSVSTMFVNLSRRSQLLVDRLIRLIDGLEQGERDPDRLSELFKLDHLATRMRRNDENLLVLGGADAGRRWTRPAPLMDVLRAATAEVEQYTRVKLGSIDETVQIASPAVNDLVHLIAEILENATSFSSPRTEVNVDARRRGPDEVVVEVMDQGIGMSREQLAELNERLAKPPVFDIAVSRMMGLFVVGRLASRHGVKVMLRDASGGGVLAIVTLPTEVLHAGQSGPATQPPAARPVERVPSERIDRPQPSEPAAQADGYAPTGMFGAESPIDQWVRASAPGTTYGSGARFTPDGPRTPDAPHTPDAPRTPDAPGAATPGASGPAPARPAPAWSAEEPTHWMPEFAESHPEPQGPAQGAPEPYRAPEPEPVARGEKPFVTVLQPFAPATAESNGHRYQDSSLATLPRLRRELEAPAAQPADPGEQRMSDVVDSTATDRTVPMPLPIFEAIESDWFRAKPPAGRVPDAPGARTVNGRTQLYSVPVASQAFIPEGTASPGGAPVGRAAADPTPGRPTRSAPAGPASGPVFPPPMPAAPPAPLAPASMVPEPAVPHRPAPPVAQPVPVAAWQSPADAGWQAARAAAEASVSAATSNGLPKRVPMARLVPGRVGAPQPDRPAPHRSAEAVRGVLSSYRSGLEQGRQTTGRAAHAGLSPTFAGAPESQQEQM